MHNPRSLFIAFALAAASLPAHAGDWPRWRGASFDDHSTDTGLLKQWPEEGATCKTPRKPGIAMKN